MTVSPIHPYLNPGDLKEAFTNKSIVFLFLCFGCMASLMQQLKDIGSSQAKFFKSLISFYGILMSQG